MPLTPLLFLSPRVPWPLVTGARIRTAALLGALREAFEVHYAGFIEGPEARDSLEAQASAPQHGFKVIHLAHERGLTRAGKAWLGLATLPGPRPVTIAKYWDPALARAVRHWISRHPGAIVHADHLHMAPYLSKLKTQNTKPPLRVIDEHNVESIIVERLAQETRSKLARAYLNLQARRLRAAETALVSRADRTLAVSQADADELARMAPGARIEVIPNGVDLDYFNPAPDRAPRPGRLIFTGSMNWLPNEDAMAWFAQEIMPLLAKHKSQIAKPPDDPAFRIPHFEFTLDIVGHAPSPAVRALAAPGTRVTGTVPDVRPYMNAAEIYVVPLRVGGGSRLKILEAFAMGVPVVSTTIGCEGLETRDGEELLIADTPGEFAAAITRLSADPALRAALAARARAHVEEHFGWQAIGRKLVDLYQSMR